MASSNFAFVPRKLAKRPGASSQRPATSTIALGPSIPNNVEGSGVEIDHGKSEDHAGPSHQRKKEKFLDDRDYAGLLVLALSDYSLWSNEKLLEHMSSNEEGFIPLRAILDSSPVFIGLTPIPPESALVRCIKDSPVLERRIIVSAPTPEEGGFEVRRRDWQTAKERIRRYTSFQWETRTVYVENLPHYARSTISALRFIESLLTVPSSTEDAQSTIQNISFPPHRDDGPEDIPMCKGFAFIVMTRTKDVDALLQQWPWRIDNRPHDSELGQFQVYSDAMDFGFRCLSKKTWDRLRDDYLGRQRKLLDEAVTMNIVKPGQSSRALDLDTVHDEVDSTNRGATSSKREIKAIVEEHTPSFLYPRDCLVFIKNIHPETNKTTVKALFSGILGGKSDSIDYVDFNKGLDSCYLRLTSPAHARALVDKLSSHKISQANGLDNTGSAAPSGASKPIEIELVQGKKEEVYWEKVPEKIRRQALEKDGLQISAGPAVEDPSLNDNASGGRKHKRRKRA